MEVAPSTEMTISENTLGVADRATHTQSQQEVPKRNASNQVPRAANKRDREESNISKDLQRELMSSARTSEHKGDWECWLSG